MAAATPAKMMSPRIKKILVWVVVVVGVVAVADRIRGLPVVGRYIPRI